MNSNSKFISALALTVGVSCGDGSVGVEPCITADGKCTVQSLNAAPSPSTIDIKRIDMQPMTELSPDWTKTLPDVDTQDLGDEYSHSVLRQDENGRLVLFFVNQDSSELKVGHLSNDGELLETIGVAPPSDWSYENTKVALLNCGDNVCINDRSPALQVTWRQDSDTDNSNGRMQKLIFSSDLSAPPLRRELDIGVIGSLVQGADGDLYDVTSDPGHYVARRDDATGRELWRQTDLVGGSKFDSTTRLSLAGVSLDDGRFVVTTGAFESAGILFTTFLDQDGKVTRVPSALPQQNKVFLLNTKDSATFVGTIFGDLRVERLQDESDISGMDFIRDDYTNLVPQATAVDPAGNVYTAMRSGSRLDSRPTICRAAVSGESTCYTLLTRASDSSVRALQTDELIARAHGELYIHSTTELLHVSFPSP